MARIIALSSLVARGHVGLSAYRPILEALGHEVTALPTVVLSNHPGHPHVAGTRIEPTTLRAMIDALAANSWLAEADAVLTGYLPSAGHVAVACDLIERVRAANPSVRIVVDPVLGDDPKGLYIDEAAATAVRDTLVAHADAVTPNRFELAWLAGRPVGSMAEAVDAARALGRAEVIATSIPVSDTRLATLLVTAVSARAAIVDREANVANGTGDVLAALVAARLPLGRAVAVVATLIAASRGRGELALIAARTAALAAAPMAEHDVTTG